MCCIADIRASSSSDTVGDSMSDNVAVLAGFTQEVIADGGEYSLALLVKPGTDFDTRFKAWDRDEQEFIRVNGWLFTIEAAECP